VNKSVYKIIELVGTSRTSWEEAARNAVETFAQKIDDLRIAEIVKLDMTIDKDKVTSYRARVKVSSKIKDGSHLFLPSFEE
jgi:dodecin